MFVSGLVSVRASIDQPFFRESSPNPNLASDRAAQQVCCHSLALSRVSEVMQSVHLSVLALPLDTVSASVASLCPLDDILPPPLHLTQQGPTSVLLLLLLGDMEWKGEDSGVTDTPSL